MRGRQTLAAVSATFVALLMILTSGAYAWNKGHFTGISSGSFATLPLDIDDDSCLFNGSTYTCTDLSTEGSGIGTSTGILKGSGTGQSVVEQVPVVGTGCLIDPSGIQSCTLGASTDACEYTYVGGSYVNRDNKGDLVFGFINAGGSNCVDFSSFPPKFSASSSGTINGGTGKYAGSTGTFTARTTGQILSEDLQGHAFGWFIQATAGIATIP